MTRGALEGRNGEVLAEVKSGPNKGYWYVEKQTYEVKRYWHINVRLTPNGPAEIPDTSQNDTVNAWTYLDRRKSSPHLIFNGVKNHEGYGSGVSKGHQGQIEAALTTSACGDDAGLVERVVKASEAEAALQVARLETTAWKALEHAASHYYVYGNHSNSPMVAYSPGQSPLIVYYTDNQSSSAPHTAPSGCVWSF